MKKSSYMVIYDTLKEQIAKGAIPVNSRLPTEPVLSSQFGVSVSTLRRAMIQLEMEKIVRREQGRGTFVNGLLAAKVESGTASHSINFGCLLTMKEQRVLNNIYFKGMPFNQVALSTLSRQNIASVDSGQGVSLIQAPLHMLKTDDLTRFFSPLPDDIVEKAEKCIPEHVLNECYTFDGLLRLLQTVINPSVCYCWKPAFEKAGIPLPDADWTYAELITCCRKLKAANSQAAFGLMPFPGILYEPLFWSFGCEFFDEYGSPWLPEEPFKRAVDILRIMHDEKLCLDLTYSSVPPHKFFSKPGVCMTFCGPLVLSSIENRDEWHICPTPEISGVTTICLGISDCATNKKEMEKLLRRLISEDNPSRMSHMQGEAPAPSHALDAWMSRLNIDGAKSFRQSVLKGRAFSPRSGFSHWYKDFYCLLDCFIRKQLSAEQFRQQLLVVLEKQRVLSGEVAAFI